ncbi:MAG: glycosyltransferase family 2 protein [Desulfuromonadaceae bacterium]|nr:glycosyltransferase family 2 protein [Desulfuromonadaceae bacterium]
MPDTYLPPNIASYLNKRAAGDPWRIDPAPSRTFSGAVVIPSLAESVNIPQTLESLSRNPAELLERFLILIVVNQRADVSDAETADNRETLRMLPLWKQQYRLHNLFWVDASTSGNELPPKQGVGLARKIGLDLTLPLLDFNRGDPLLICLDADTVVQPDYLAAITGHFAASSAGGATIPYRHRPAGDPAGQSAIDRYELFLRLYVFGLAHAGSPYAFHTVGSAMACTASAYVASGGMNSRLAGEDFYFLQQLHKTSGVVQLTGTVVHPSPRSSHRVPFGTGRAVGDMLADGEQRLLFYQPVVFSIVGEWLACVRGNIEAESASLLESSSEISPVLHQFLEQSGFAASWDNLKKNNRDSASLLTAFHGWFDAFRTMRLIHELSYRIYPRIPPKEAIIPMFEYTGTICSDTTMGGQLELLRKIQGNNG